MTKVGLQARVTIRNKIKRILQNFPVVPEIIDDGVGYSEYITGLIYSAYTIYTLINSDYIIFIPNWATDAWWAILL